QRNSAAGLAAASASSSSNAVESAQHIDRALRQVDNWIAAGAAGHGNFIEAAGQFLHAPSESVAITSIDSLSGQIHASSHALTLAQSGLVNRALADRLQDTAQEGGWAQLVGANGAVGRSGFATGRYSGGGAMAGYDVKLAGQWLVGAAAQWNKLNASYNQEAG